MYIYIVCCNAGQGYIQKNQRAKWGGGARHTCNINQCKAAESSDMEQRAQIWSRELQNARSPGLPAGPATAREEGWQSMV